jgi:hypothetical protein
MSEHNKGHSFLWSGQILFLNETQYLIVQKLYCIVLAIYEVDFTEFCFGIIVTMHYFGKEAMW